MERVKDDDDMVCLDESFFNNDNYQRTTFTFGSQVLELHCLESASRLTAEKLDWANSDHLKCILEKHPRI